MPLDVHPAGDSGIGRAAAIAFAREGADVAINYLPVEEPDAQAGLGGLDILNSLARLRAIRRCQEELTTETRRGLARNPAMSTIAPRS